MPIVIAPGTQSRIRRNADAGIFLQVQGIPESQQEAAMGRKVIATRFLLMLVSARSARERTFFGSLFRVPHPLMARASGTYVRRLSPRTNGAWTTKCK